MLIESLAHLDFSEQFLAYDKYDLLLSSLNSRHILGNFRRYRTNDHL